MLSKIHVFRPSLSESGAQTVVTMMLKMDIMTVKRAAEEGRSAERMLTPMEVPDQLKDAFIWRCLQKRRNGEPEDRRKLLTIHYNTVDTCQLLCDHDGNNSDDSWSVRRMHEGVEDPNRGCRGFGSWDRMSAGVGAK